MKNITFFLIFGCVCLGGFVGRPLYQNRQTLLDKQQVLVEQKQAFVEKFTTLQEKSAKKATTALQAIPVRYNQEQFINSIETLTQKNGFSTQNMNFSLGYNDSVKTSEMNATFSIAGNFQDLYQFLVDVEQHPYFMGLRSFGISYDEESRNNLLDVSLYTFYLDDSA